MGEIVQPARRREELSLCNLAFCAMVLLLHLCSDTIVTAPKDTPFYVLVYTVWKLCAMAVYGFLFLGGLKACLGRRQPLSTYYKRRARSVLLPYLVWSVAYYFVRLLLNHAAFSPLDLLAQLALGSTAAHLYFVIIILQCYALIPLWRAMVDRLPAAVALPVLALLAAVLPNLLTHLWQQSLPETPVYLDRIFVNYLFFWCAGCYAGAQYERFCALLRQSRSFLLVTAVLVLPVYVYYSYQNQVHLQWFGFLTPLHQLFCAVGIGAVLALAQPVATRLMRPWAMQALDRASYQIYLGHMLPLIAAPGLMRRMGVPDLAVVQLLVRSAIVLVPTLGVCLLWQAARRKNGLFAPKQK